MRKLFIITLLITTVVVFGQVNNYDMELVHTFVAGDYSPKYIEPYLGPQTNNPASFYFDNDGNLFVADSTFRRIVKYNKDFNFIEEYKDLWSSRYKRIVIQDELCLASHQNSFLVEKLNGEIIFNLATSRLEREFSMNSYKKNFNFLNGVVTFSTLEGEIFQIKNPSPEIEKNVIEAVELEDETDVKSRVVKNNSLNNFKELSYYLNYKKNVEKLEETDSRSIKSDNLKLSDIEFRSEKYMEYIGSDIDGNVYWNDSYRKILIFNSNYQLIDAFNTGLDYADTDPVVHPSGDVYFMDITNEEAKLLRVKRVW